MPASASTRALCRVASALIPLALLLLPPATLLAAEPGTLGYYRFPSVHGNTVVFTAEGDLWRVPIEGGLAERLTTHLGEESRAAVAPDGKRVAFSATYEGPMEVYVMPLEGGVPRRLTWDGLRDLVVGWTPAGEVLVSPPGAGPRGARRGRGLPRAPRRRAP